MFLKSLSLQGFKSFAQRVTIELPHGVAAIVGPNGSGKSNIADAIRWVLGEQSIRALRGTRLEDVIFVGSDTRRPVGMAEVSLTFDNASGRIPLEYSEVTVTRRVYRSGESEFLINRNPCRLRDIQELFMDTGIGRGSLAIIGQGEVDAVLSARPEDRRAFLEEAAGITRYRSRKTEALQKMAQTEESLVRVGDIIAEVERRLEPLEKQAEAARTHARLTRELAALERALLGRRRERLEREYQAAAARVAELEAERERVRAHHARLEEEAGALARELDEIDAALEELRREGEAARQQASEARHREAMARERLAQAERDEEERRRRLTLLADRQASLVAERERLAAARAHAEAEVARAERELAAAAERLESLRARIEARDQALAGERARAERLAEEIARLRAELRGLEERDGALARREEEHRGARAELEAEAAAAEEALGAGRRRAVELEAACGEADQAHRALEERLEALGRERSQVAEAFSRERGRLQELRARRQALSEMDEAREGYHRAVRAVLRAALERGWALRGAVAELFDVPEEYEVAIEVALGPAQQFVVARRDEDAKAAIAFLKERGLGRATFLPLESLRPSLPPSDALARLKSIEGAIGMASDLVRADESVRPAVLYLLGRVAVARDLDAAIAVARQVRGLSRVVTLDGDVVVPGGAMTGGSRQERSDGLLGRGRRLQELARGIAELEAAVAARERRIAQIDGELERVRAELRRAGERRRELELERHGALRDVREAEARSARARQVAAAWDETERRLRAEREELAARLQVLAERLRHAEAERESLDARVSAREEGREEERGDEERLREELGRCRVALAALSQEREQHAREAERLERERAELDSEARAEEERLAAVAEAKRLALAAIEAAERTVAESAAAADAAEERRRAAQEVREARRRRRDEVGAELKAAQEALAGVQESLGAARVELDRRERDRAAVLAALAALGEADPEEADPAAGLSEPALERRMRALRAQVEALGPVDPRSIAEFEAVRERHAFLTGQREDLVQAKEQLREVIARIDRESRSKFDTVFRAVQEEFAKVFTRLFGGGSARLELADPADPLESGIEIYVQPPGKKLQNLLALSGGERALAATALLFAILAVRPSPFCVLDEIDAALDEHNLERFRQLLVEFSASTQFLVITHRQATMEGAGCLFGVTMEESGVSRLVSLKMEQIGA